MSAEALAQIDGYPVSGQVIDRQTRAAVPYAAVLIVGDETSGVMTDSLGRFRFADAALQLTDSMVPL